MAFSSLWFDYWFLALIPPPTAKCPFSAAQSQQRQEDPGAEERQDMEALALGKGWQDQPAGIDLRD